MVYLDSNVFIHAAADDAEVGDKARKIISAIQQGEVKAWTSVLALDETVWALRKLIGEEEAMLASSAFCFLPGLEILSATRSIFLDSIEDMRHSKLKPRDALHTATMKAAGLSEIVSEDPDFDKVKGVKRVKIADFKIK